jgi:tellurite methyltransferase
VLRAIESFEQDSAGDWVARLRCGHGQHMRHKPPFWTRGWVTTPEGRAAKLGVEVECPLCDRFELPAGFAPYKTTPTFEVDTIPSGLRKDHSTKPGVWARIRVLAGRLEYTVEQPLARTSTLEPGKDGIVVAEVPHRVTPLDREVRFYVEFYRRSDAA